MTRLAAALVAAPAAFVLAVVVDTARRYRRAPKHPAVAQLAAARRAGAGCVTTDRGVAKTAGMEEL